MKILVIVAICAVFAAAFLFLVPETVTVMPGSDGANISLSATSSIIVLPPIPEADRPASSSSTVLDGVSSNNDIGPQRQLVNPPNVIKGVYLTGWSGGYAPKVNYLINLAQKTEVNAVVIDIKDYSGYVSYVIDDPLVKGSGADNQVKITQPNALIKKLHDAGIYVIGRITVFQDPVLAKAHPEWALHNASTSKVWSDNHGLAWMDPAAKPVWDYDVAIAKDALSRGFDEINFDYVRFASDGDLSLIQYPFWDQKTPKHVIIGRFFKYLRDSMPDAKLSADLFGLTTVNHDDLGIGQVIEDAYKYFDAVAPMVYPSHYATGFLGYQNPAKYPYEVIKYSMDHAVQRLEAGEKVEENVSSTSATSTGTITTSVPYRAKLRPWLQDFDLGATYDAAMVKKEMQATYDSLLNFISTPPSMITSTSTLIEAPNSSEAYYGGWLLWDPSNVYTAGALKNTN
ncbi:MAG: hypothetical protein KGJ89_04595 [Patescibacteria group bacterium]|nr:hypothetical protein [Patescibacteria group bacterium]MDE2015831.1 hypothetical protein [Patescibacteria group bacterium]MDE2227206.1 hypothetical protein [Patescibacteria group bacterium]